MKNLESLNKLQELIEKYDFEELSKKDKDFILTISSQEEYKELRSIVVKSKYFFENQNSVEPDDKTLGKLHNLLEEKSWIRSIIYYQIPLYKIAVSIIILFGILFIFINQKYTNEVNLIAQVDTVYIENYDTVKIIEYDTVETTKNVLIYKEEYDHLEYPINANLIQSQIIKEHTLSLKTRSFNPKDLNRLLRYSKSSSVKYDKNPASYIVKKL